MDNSVILLQAALLCLSLYTHAVFSGNCPQHQGSDPNDVNGRIQKLANQDIYYANDDDYKYKIAVCQRNTLQQAAVQQMGLKWKPDRGWLTVGTYKKAHVTGGTNWLMIKYFGGEKYHTHCSGIGRMAIVFVTCDPGTQRGSMKVIEEYRNGTKGRDDPMECYYLFELNHDAACSHEANGLIPVSVTALVVIIAVQTLLLMLVPLYCVLKQRRQRTERNVNTDSMDVPLLVA
ncbi:cation-dependent mannose-6-phosphate receptor-like [Montipora capricornis]|uniref:cation-dependent mannose-6-phosphate receptor-like n=1 Tax=Montipora capricornis TaxID=246305 RepID=UPI0035F1EBA9